MAQLCSKTFKNLIKTRIRLDHCGQLATCRNIIREINTDTYEIVLYVFSSLVIESRYFEKWEDDSHSTFDNLYNYIMLSP